MDDPSFTGRYLGTWGDVLHFYWHMLREFHDGSDGSFNVVKTLETLPPAAFISAPFWSSATESLCFDTPLCPLCTTMAIEDVLPTILVISLIYFIIRWLTKPSRTYSPFPPFSLIVPFDTTDLGPGVTHSDDPIPGVTSSMVRSNP